MLWQFRDWHHKIFISYYRKCNFTPTGRIAILFIKLFIYLEGRLTEGEEMRKTEKSPISWLAFRMLTSARIEPVRAQELNPCPSRGFLEQHFEPSPAAVQFGH